MAEVDDRDREEQREPEAVPELCRVVVGVLSAVPAVIAYWIGHTVARPVLHRFLGVERFERTEAMIERGGVTLLLALCAVVAAAGAKPLIDRYLDERAESAAA